MIRLSLVTGIPLEQVVEMDANIMSTYFAVLEDLQKEGSKGGVSRGDNAGI